MNQNTAIKKILSKNDTGETGGHQAGMHIPKQEEILSFFPNLNKSIKNPRVLLIFKDQINTQWSFSFIYYNNKFFGGTRNEYRLTGMTKYFNAYRLKEGDEIVLQKDIDGFYYITFKKKSEQYSIENNKLKLNNNWIAIKI